MRGPWIGHAPATQPVRRISADGFDTEELGVLPLPDEEPLNAALLGVARQEPISALTGMSSVRP